MGLWGECIVPLVYRHHSWARAGGCVLALAPLALWGVGAFPALPPPPFLLIGLFLYCASLLLLIWCCMGKQASLPLCWHWGNRRVTPFHIFRPLHGGVGVGAPRFGLKSVFLILFFFAGPRRERWDCCPACSGAWRWKRSQTGAESRLGVGGRVREVEPDWFLCWVPIERLCACGCVLCPRPWVPTHACMHVCACVHMSQTPGSCICVHTCTCLCAR